MFAGSKISVFFSKRHLFEAEAFLGISLKNHMGLKSVKKAMSLAAFKLTTAYLEWALQPILVLALPRRYFYKTTADNHSLGLQSHFNDIVLSANIEYVQGRFDSHSKESPHRFSMGSLMRYLLIPFIQRALGVLVASFLLSCETREYRMVGFRL